MLGIFADEDVFGFNVAVVYTGGMAGLDRVDDLEEEALDGRIVAAV